MAQSSKFRILLRILLPVSLLVMGGAGLCQCVSLKHPAKGNVLEETSDPVLAKSLERHVVKVVDGFGRRCYLDTSNLDKVADYVAGELEKAGCAVERQEVQVKARQYQNVIGVLKGKLEKKIIIGAHYDSHIDTPGADDNASAVAGLIELAVLLGKRDLEHTVEFVAYCNEEPPFFDTEHMGSAHHAKRVKQNNDDVAAMICLEMIGYYSEKPDSQDYPAELLHLFLPSTGDFIGVVGNGTSLSLARLLQREMAKRGSLPVARMNWRQSRSTPLDFSDHRNYWAYGYNAVMITDTSFYRNPNYHKETDTPDTLDYRRMADVVKSLAGAVMVLDAEGKGGD